MNNVSLVRGPKSEVTHLGLLFNVVPLCGQGNGRLMDAVSDAGRKPMCRHCSRIAAELHRLASGGQPE